MHLWEARGDVLECKTLEEKYVDTKSYNTVNWDLSKLKLEQSQY